MEPALLPIRPGQVLFLYTDGVFEQLPEQSRRKKKRDFLERISRMAGLQSCDPKKILEQLGQSLEQSLTPRLVDDWTMVVCQAPEAASFEP
jgi:serine phosphatase RsbU (regulator of sigma subunit)